MSIEAHCPNPRCAQTHHVKVKYAGMRGKCPACGEWMLIPKLASPVGPVPSAPLPTSAAWGEEPAPAAGPTVSLAPDVVAEPQLATPVPAARAEGRKSPAKAAEEAAVPIADDAVEVAEADVVAAEEDIEVAEETPRPRRRFSWFAAALTLLGMVSVMGVSVAGFLQDYGPAITVKGSFQNSSVRDSFENLKLTEDEKVYVVAVPCAIAFLAFLGLSAAVATRRFGILPRLLGYLTTFATGTGLVFIAIRFRNLLEQEGRVLKSAAGAQSRTDFAGELTVTIGAQPWVALCSAAAATLCFALATFLMHRLPGKIFFLVVLLLAAAGGVAAVWTAI